jgi:hypothetical protein
MDGPSIQIRISCVLEKRVCLSMWWGHHPIKYEAIMKINKEHCVQVPSHCVTMSTCKSDVYHNIKYVKYIFVFFVS